MWRIVAAVVALLAGLPYSAVSSRGQSGKVLTWIKGSGSLPPVPGLYTCAPQMDGRAYDAARAQSCLRSMLASGYFTDGHIETRSGNSHVFVDFVLNAPSLRITKLDFGVAPQYEKELSKWFQRGGQPLCLGCKYDKDADAHMATLIGMFFADLGRRAGISRTARLNYRAGTADVVYHMTLGPQMVKVRGMAPFEPDCARGAVNVNRMDVDDYVPLVLVEKLTRLHWLDCFDSKIAAEDEKTLKRSGIFRSASYDVENEKSDPTIMVHLKGKQLEVEALDVVGYGLLAGRSFTDAADLPLKPGAVYRKSEAYAAVQALQSKYSGSTDMVQAYEDDLLIRNDELRVTFQLLAYPQDRVIVNGTEVHSPAAQQ